MTEEQRTSRSIFEDGPGRRQPEEEPAATCSCRAWWKVAVVVVLLAVVAGIIASKTGGGASSRQEPARSGVGPAGSSPIQPAAKPGDQAGPEAVLAIVNGEPITLGGLDKQLSALPEQHRAAFERSKHEFLEELIAREVLLQQARRLGSAVGTDAGNPGPSAAEKSRAVQDLLRRQVLDHVEVGEPDLRAFYEEHRDEIPGGRSFEEVKDALHPYVLREKQQAAIESYLADLRAQADIRGNEGWIDVQKALAADNPLDRALVTGRPVVADFGRGACIPCQMMKPILDELAKEYAGRAEVLIISVDEYPALTERCRIRAIPTQIFYDASGRESHRHEGFMPREDVVAGLAQMGVK